MRSVLLVRFAGVMLALFTASFIAFPSFPSAGMFASNPAPSVNRVLKGDRLPLIGRALQTRELESPTLPASPVPPAAGGKLPVGCEAAFSPISAPQLANVFRRCFV
jgi:hypothetical protein